MNAADIDKLWDFDDPAASEERFRTQLSTLEGEDSSTRFQLMTQIARTLGLRNRFDEAHRLLDEVEAKMPGGDLVEVRYLLERGRCFNSDHQPEKAVPLFERAAELGRRLSEDFYTVDALHMLGIAAPEDDRMRWNQTAMDAANASLDERARGWVGSLSNNMGWTYFDQADYKSALDMFRQAEEGWSKQGKDDLVRVARWSQGKALRLLGRVEEALAMQRDLEKEELTGFTAEEIAECLLALNQPAEAGPYFQKAYDELSQIGWVAEGTDRIERLKQHAK